jgi:hypothetical protein
METFLDGGLFELLLAIFFAFSLNFIFLKKYLLIAFSILVIAAPTILFFINKHGIYYWLVSLCSFNSIFLVVLLWKEKRKNPQTPLFNIETMKTKLTEIRNKISSFFLR